MIFDSILVLQGGAMRSVFTDGVLDAFLQNNIMFKTIYGVSASSKDMFYYASGQEGVAYKANLECAKDPNTFNMSNALLGKPVIDSAYYFNEIRDKKYPYHIEKIIENNIDLYITCCDIDEMKAVYFKAPCDNLDKKIEASCSLPVIQPIVEIDSKHYLDGGIVENVPLSKALLDNKKIIVVTTREDDYKAEENKTNGLENTFINLKYQDRPELVQKLLNRNSDYNKEMENLKNLEKDGRVFVLRPTSTKDFDRLERDENKLIALYLDGYNTALKQIEALFEYLK